MSPSVLVDGSNLTGAGAQSIGQGLLPPLCSALRRARVTLLLPADPSFRGMALPSSTSVIFIGREPGVVNELNRLRELAMGTAHAARHVQADACLILGDLLPIRLPGRNTLFVQQPLLVYDDDELAGRGGWSLAKRIFLKTYFSCSAKAIDRVIVQTPVMAARLSQKYRIPIDRVSVIPQPVPNHILQRGPTGALYSPIANCPKPIKLLFLAAYYPHKNHAVLPAVALELRRRGLAGKVQIFTTADDKTLNLAGLSRAWHEYSDVLTNLGPISRDAVANAFHSSSALFLPTLAESYGLIYLEAMACGTPILTSDRDFAHWMCGELAVFFDPLDPNSIVDSIAGLLARPPSADSYDRAVQGRMAEFPKNWTEVARQFAHTIDIVHP